MAKTNRNLQAKYIKACAQRRESAIAEYTKAPYLMGGKTFGDDIPGRLYQSKLRAIFNRDKLVERTTHAIAQRYTKVQTAAQAAWADAGEVRLYRNGKLVG